MTDVSTDQPADSTTSSQELLLDGLSLPALFDKAYDAHSRADSETVPPDELEVAIKYLAECTSRIRHLALFSSNEEIDDVATGDIKYLLVPWLHADLLQRVPAFPTAPAPSAAAAAAAGPGSSTMRPSASPVAIASARTAALRSSLQHLASFLDSMDRLRVPLESERSDVVRAHALAASTAGSGGNGNGNGNGNGSEVKDLDATAKRALKVQRFKRERELKGRLEAIRRRKAERQQRVRKARPGAGAQADAGEDASADGAAVGSGLEDDDDDDEVDEREAWMLALRLAIVKAMDLVDSLARERQMLHEAASADYKFQSDRSGTTANPFAPEALDDRLRKREGSHRAAAAAAAAAAAGGRQLVPPQAIACATLAQDVIEGRVPREEIANHRHTAPMVFGPMSLMSAAAKRGPGSGSVLGGITGSMSGSGSAAARDPLASLRVFQPSHSVARMSIEEAGEREMAMMAAWKERTRKEMEEQGMIVREDDGKGQGKGEDGEDEVDEEEEERRMGGRYLDDEEDVDKARKWDDYTDDHRRGPGGAGMMMGMGGGMGGAMGYPGGGGMPRGGPGGGGMHMGGGPRALPVVKLRGLPFSCEEGDVAEFFAGLDVVDVLFLRRDSKFSGEALVVFGNAIQAELSLQRNRMSMGRRYVEIFRCKRADYYNAVANEVAQDGGQYKGPETQGHQGAGRMGGGRPYRGYGEGGGGGMDGHPAVEHTGVLKLRGIPYSATKQDIVAFFDGFPLSESSVHIVVGADGRSTGEAFAEFASPGDAAAAMGRDRSRMGTRYVELFASSREEAARGVAKAK
ncbi:unnamed protein product [Closterium sp. NIES-65]|nr:unnamed protein product [Closterium sp. NIES-65]